MRISCIYVSSLPFSFPDNGTYPCLLTFLAALKENGHQSVLEKMADWNKVELVVNGECVYTCSIKQLEFGKFNVDTVDYSVKVYRLFLTCGQL